jgi:scyllo-inositol 2-dehydrogenase (NADP+)
MSTGVALIGYGLAGQVFHGPLIAATPGLEVRRIVTSNPQRRARAAVDFPEAKLLPGTDELWNDLAGIDLVVVATVNTLHASQAITALEQGKATVVDKPMALSTVEATRILEAAERTGRPLAVFQNRRWDSDFLLLRQLVEGDRLGGIRRVESRFERYKPQVQPGSWRDETPPEQGGGLLSDTGAHLIDQAHVLLGHPDTVYAEIASGRAGGAADDDCFVALGFAAGTRVHLWMSALAPSTGARWRVWGSRAAFECWGLDPQEPQIVAGGRPGAPGFGEPDGTQHAVLSEGAAGSAGENLPLPAGRYVDFYAGMAAAVRGEAPVPVPATAGWDALAVIEAARESAATKSVVRPRFRSQAASPG